MVVGKVVGKAMGGETCSARVECVRREKQVWYKDVMYFIE